MSTPNLGASCGEDELANLKHGEFNPLLLEHYADEPIFDLATRRIYVPG